MSQSIKYFLKFQILTVFCAFCMDWKDVDLPESHLRYYFNRFPHLINECLSENNCPYKDYLEGANLREDTACWGYEHNCSKVNAYERMKCPGENTGWVPDKQAQVDTFYNQADFGYIRNQLNSLSIMCEPLFQGDSSLECSEYLRYCRGRNIMINFTDLINREEPYRYKMDVLSQGQIGGYCKLHGKRLKDEADHISALQSWAPELRYFESLPKRPLETEGLCDIIVDKPTYIMKLDATINMYHHFCDFFNLYASLHLNLSRENSFTKDISILIWETFTYESPFEDTFKVFTSNPILDLKHYKGKVVCFKHLVLPLLPRMIFGLYYNTPIIHGCENSGLFNAFSEFILHRMQIPLYKRTTDKIRITLLSRKTRFRNMLNEEELYDKIKQNSDYEVRRVAFSSNIPFYRQLEVIRNTDILIGMHGAGLTHLLFLPNWASLFEVHNCEDPACYKDLSRLRGIHYITWEDQSKVEKQDEGQHPEGGAHAKFTNYAFDVHEFSRLVGKAARHVGSHVEFQELLKSQGIIKNDSSLDVNLIDEAKDEKLHNKNTYEHHNEL